MTATVLSTPAGPGAPAIPLLAARFGYAGLIPFVAGAALVWIVQPDDARAFALGALTAWAALIVSFMAGIPWALAMQRPELAPPGWWVPSLFAGLAWLALLMRAPAGLVVLAALLVAGYLVDRRFYPRAGLGHWLTLRFRLSTVAAVSCLLGAGGA